MEFSNYQILIAQIIVTTWCCVCLGVLGYAIAEYIKLKLKN
jgi:hypothetical protein